MAEVRYGMCEFNAQYGMGTAWARHVNGMSMCESALTEWPSTTFFSRGRGHSKSMKEMETGQT